MLITGSWIFTVSISFSVASQHCHEHMHTVTQNYTQTQHATYASVRMQTETKADRKSTDIREISREACRMPRTVSLECPIMKKQGEARVSLFMHMVRLVGTIPTGQEVKD